MTHFDQEIRVLAIHPNHRGFGFVVFEWGERLIDWGLKTAKDDTNTQCMKVIENLIELYTPDVIVIEDVVARSTRRGPRVKNLIRRISRLATQKRIQCIRFSRAKIMETFAGTLRNKYQVANIIAAKLPELARRLPKPRKAWMPEDPRMSIFGATALALTFFSDNGEGSSNDSV
jgi:Holliday junction resolvasome RuvABC endonuclease subunit